MAWQENLQDASFRGVPFDCINTSDSSRKSLVAHSIPYTNGAELEDTGEDAGAVRIQAIFFGDDYETRLDDFRSALSAPGAGELVHPVFGAMQVVVAEQDAVHDADAPDSCTVTVTFMRDGITTATFADKTILQLADSALQAADVALAKSVETLTAQTGKVSLLQKTLNGIKRATRLADRARQAAAQARQFAKNVISTAYSIIDAPRAFAADMAALANGMIDLRAFDKDVIMAQWRSLADDFGKALRLPNDGKDVDPDTRRDDNTLTLFLGVQEFNVLTQVAVTILSGEAGSPALTPVELEEITNTMRLRGQALIDEHRALGDDVDGYAVIEAIKESADALQRTAAALLADRPALVRRTVEQPISLRLLAHHWYGDHERAIELLRLNPQIRHPNFLQPGDVLNAYAE